MQILIPETDNHSRSTERNYQFLGLLRRGEADEQKHQWIDPFTRPDGAKFQVRDLASRTENGVALV